MKSRPSIYAHPRYAVSISGGTPSSTCNTLRQTKTGVTSENAISDGGQIAFASKFVASAAYTACKGVLRLSQSGGAGTMKFGIFTDNAGEPGALIGSYSDPVNCSSPTGSEGDVTFSNMSANLINGTTYWAVLWFFSGSGVAWYAYVLPGTDLKFNDGAWDINSANASFKYALYSN